ncbi:MAG: hypothetical protein QXF26_02815 [Candidatus Bathyarchaeia archaeon]
MDLLKAMAVYLKVLRVDALPEEPNANGHINSQTRLTGYQLFNG